MIKKKHTLIITYQQGKMKSNSRPEIPITGNYIKTGGGYIKYENKKFYRETKHMPKLKRLNKRHFNEKMNSKVYFNVFRGANIERLHHFIQPTLHQDKADTVLIHIGSNDSIPSK